MVVAALVLAGMSALPGQAQDNVLGELYGQGVHAYFAGDVRTAHEMLTNAIQQGSVDPRCFYFRGLAYARLGRPDESSADFKKGAELEAGNADRVFQISESLQRIQGRSRVQIEKYRQMARLTVRAKAHKVEQARFEQLQNAEQEVLRNPNAKPAAKVDALPAPPAAAAKNDPFAEGNQVTPEKAPEKPAAAAAAPAVADPFGAAPATPEAAPTMPPATPPAAEAADPFGAAPTTPATPATPPATDTPKEDSKTDPFSDDKPAEAKPAEGKPAETPPEKPADKSDPFGG